MNPDYSLPVYPCCYCDTQGVPSSAEDVGDSFVVVTCINCQKPAAVFKTVWNELCTANRSHVPKVPNGS